MRADFPNGGGNRAEIEAKANKKRKKPLIWHYLFLLVVSFAISPYC